MSAPKIECEKCHAPGTTPEAVVCAKCAGRVIRVCGDCGFSNSLAKRFCDTCGSKFEGQADHKEVKGSVGKVPDNFVFESLAESAANELEEVQRKKAGAAPKPAEPKPPEPKPVEAKRPEPKPIPVQLPSLPEKPASPPPPSAPKLNDQPGLKLELPGSSVPPAPAPRPNIGLPHTVMGRMAPPQNPKKPAQGAEPAPGPAGPGEPSRAAPPPKQPPPPARAPAPTASKPAPSAAPGGGGRKVASLPSVSQASALFSSQFGAKASMIAAVLLLLSGIGLWSVRKRHMGQPEVQVPITARRYLNALKAGDFQTAYGLLTDASRRSCPLEDFKRVRDNSAWDFSDLSIVAIERDLAFIRYKLRVANRDAEEDFLVFQREGSTWQRPFVWNLLRDAEDAFDRGAPAEALRVSRVALEVNSRDPMAQAYVCEALYYLKDAARGEEIVRECRSALDLAERYPSPLSLTPGNLYHLRAILGDTLKNTLHRYREAADQYTALLLFPRISPADQCEVLLGRAECRLALGDFQGAVQDLSRSATLCEKPVDAEYGRKTAAIYNGAAQREAIELAQSHHLEAGGPSLLEWRREARAEITRQWKAQGRGAPPSEDWFAQHISGAQYRVEVRAGSAVLFSASVDLANRTVRAETQ